MSLDVRLACTSAVKMGQEYRRASCFAAIPKLANGAAVSTVDIEGHRKTSFPAALRASYMHRNPGALTGSLRDSSDAGVISKLDTYGRWLSAGNTAQEFEGKRAITPSASTRARYSNHELNE